MSSTILGDRGYRGPSGRCASSDSFSTRLGASATTYALQKMQRQPMPPVDSSGVGGKRGWQGKKH